MASMNATAMAEILGIAPPEISTSSGSASPAIVHQGISSASIQPVSYTKLEEVVSPARTDGNWPIAPPRSFPAFASSSSTTLAATFDPSATIPSSFPSFAPSSTSTLASTFPKFASSSSSTIAATFTTTEVVAEVVEVAEKSKKRSRVKGDEQEEAERKRLKKEKKLAKLA